MNAIVKQKPIHTQSLVGAFNARVFVTIILLSLLLLSAISLVYQRAMYRDQIAVLDNISYQIEHANLERNQLLAQRTRLLAESHVEKLAGQSGMYLPLHVVDLPAV